MTARAGIVRSAPTPSADTAEFWEATARHELVFPRCVDCERFRFPPTLFCSCGSENTAWIAAAGTGVIYSFTVVHRSPSPEFDELVPYALAIVQADEGPRMMTNIVNCDVETLSIGQRVRVVFVSERGDASLPFFEPDEREAP